MKKFHDSEGRRIVLITYMRSGNAWMPRKVFVSHKPKRPGVFASYDCRWSRHHGKLYYQGGDSGALVVSGHPEGKQVRVNVWWDAEAAPGLETESMQSQRIALLRDPLPLGPKAERNPLRYGTLRLGVFCTRCRDYYPEDSPCGHVFWCNACEGWGGRAEDKACKHRRPQKANPST